MIIEQPKLWKNGQVLDHTKVCPEIALVEKPQTMSIDETMVIGRVQIVRRLAARRYDGGRRRAHETLGRARFPLLGRYRRAMS